MWPWLWARLLSRVFGDGFGADVAGRASVYLVGQVKEALDRDEERLSRLRLRPGDEVTVIARPPATRAERKLSAQQRALRERRRELSRPTRAQLRVARRLARAQRRLDRRRPGSRRFARAARREAALGARFDRLMAPTKRQRALGARLDAVTAELDASRAARLAAVRGSTARAGAARGRRRRRTAVTVYE